MNFPLIFALSEGTRGVAGSLFVPRAAAWFLLVLTPVALCQENTQSAESEPELLEIRKIWDQGGHNAFTDIIRFGDQWYCTFREADGHVKGDGKIRVITSNDGESWKSAALLEETEIDLRDPKISITPDGRLMLVMGGSVYENDELVGRQPRVSFSEDGTNWTKPERVLSEGDWLWRVTWHKGVAYGVSYHAPREGEWTVTLYKSNNGIDYEKVTTLEAEGRPNETTLRFLPDDTMVALLRREAGSQGGLIGHAAPPYTDWTWNDTGHRLGGPNFILAPDGQYWAGSRSYPGGAKTVLARMTLDSYDPVLTLPSGGDCSYPGLVWHDGLLWMSYYSSHEGKTSIYLAKIRVPINEETAYRYEPREFGSYMRGWLLSGAFPAGAPHSKMPEGHHLSRFDNDFLASMDGETEAAPNAGQSFTFDETSYTWKAHWADEDAVDLDTAVSRKEGVLAYAYAEIQSPEARPAVLSLGTNDGVRVWLNGQVVWDVPGGRGLTPDEDRVPIALESGLNRLLLKIEERGNTWGLISRLLPLTDDTIQESKFFRMTMTGEGQPVLELRQASSLSSTVVENVEVRAYDRREPGKAIWESTLESGASWPVGVDASRFGRYELKGRIQFVGGAESTFSLPFLAGRPGNYTLFEDGQSDYSIVLGANASESEMWAANELQKWIEEVGGVSIPIVSNPRDIPEKAIILGHNAYTITLLGEDVPEPAPDDESFTYENIGASIIIHGGRQRGTMYGVMSFLERELGCRFYTPSVTVTPKKKQYTFSELRHSESPGVRVRNDFYYEAFDPTWAARNRVNGTMNQREQPGGLEGYWAVHTFYPLLPPSEFFDEHPEYFSLIDGERTHDRAQLCLTNPDVLDIITERLRTQMREEPNYLIYSVSQNDWHGACQCADCQAIAKREGSEAGVIVWFVNQVAERIEDEFPDKYIGTLAYQYTRHPPKNIKPRENVVIRLCSIECCFAHDFRNCPRNEAFLKDLRGWSAIAPHLYIWDYVVNFSHYLLPYPNFDVLQANIRTLNRNSAIGIMEQGAYQSRGGEFAELRAYVLAKLLWNPDCNVNAVIDDFMYGYYGRSGQHVRAYFDLLHGQITPDTHIGLGLQPDDPIFTNDFVDRADSIFDEAESVADNTEILHRVEMARLPLMYLKCKRNPEMAVLEGTYERFKKIVDREGITHYAESGASHREAFHAEMEAALAE